MGRTSLLLLCTITLLTACRPYIPVPPELLPPTRVLIDRARLPGLAGITALARVRVSSPKGSGSLTQAIAAREPSSLRLEGLGPMSNVLFLFVLHGGSMEAFSARDNVFYAGTSSSRNIGRFLPFEIPPEAIVSIALGKAVLLAPLEGTLRVSDERRGYILSGDLRDLPGRQTIIFDRDTLDPLSTTITGAGGSPSIVVTFSRYEAFGGLRFPREVRLEIPPERVSVRLAFTQVSLNPRIRDDMFSLEIPAGSVTESLDDR